MSRLLRGRTLLGKPVAVFVEISDDMIERACAVLEDAGYDDTHMMDREAVRDALDAAFYGAPKVDASLDDDPSRPAAFAPNRQQP